MYDKEQWNKYENLLIGWMYVYGMYLSIK